METQKNSPKSKVTRWWPAVVVIAGFALALAVIWSAGGDNQQYRVLRTLAAISISSLLLAAWALFFSRLAKRTRRGNGEPNGNKQTVWFAHHNEDLLPPTLHRPAPDINTLGQATYDERPVLSRLPRPGEAIKRTLSARHY